MWIANLLGAFLLFQVQPMIAKFILPWFGGAAAVWITCMLFFQVTLLGGYLYAHRITRLGLRRRRIVHSAVLAVSLLFLPILPSPWWKTASFGEPALHILALLAAVVGIPYAVLSSTSPLIQSEHTARFPGAQIPYYFYALSNLGSMVALLSYPIVVEPWLGATAQIYLWSAGFAAYACLVISVMLFDLPRAAHELAPERVALTEPREPIRLVWLAGPACATFSLMAGTQFLLENVAAVPMLWILPLCAYLISFMVSFSKAQIYSNRVFRVALLFAVVLGLALIFSPLLRFRIGTGMAAVTIIIFLISVYCHGEVYLRRPGSSGLTAFYLALSAGGAIGGFVAAVLLPLTLTAPLDFVLSLGAALVFGFVLERNTRSIGLAMAALAGLLVVVANVQRSEFYKHSPASVRSFYGVLAVRQIPPGEGLPARRALVHGIINHGWEVEGPDGPRIATGYYGQYSGVDIAIQRTRRPGQRVGVIGLGIGSIAAYGQPDDLYRFYELSPEVVNLCRQHFHIVPRSKAQVDIVVGDARVQIEREPPQAYDVLAVDAFSGDAIPMHLLTLEAIGAYLRHLAPSGILAFHVSNRLVDLEPVLAEAAASAGLAAKLVVAEGDPGKLRSRSTWVLASRSQQALSSIGNPLRRRAGFRVWTDDFGDLWSVLRK